MTTKELAGPRVLVGILIVALATFLVPEARGQCYRIYPVQELVPSFLFGGGNGFGSRIDVDGDRLAVGTPFETGLSGPTSIGAVYMFERSGGVWTQTQRVRAPDPAAFDQFGYDVSICGDRMAVIAAGADAGGDTWAGAVYIFEYIGGFWKFDAKLTASDASSGLVNFHYDVSIEGDVMAVTSRAGQSSFVYVYEKLMGSWVEVQKIPVVNSMNNALIGGALFMQHEGKALGKFVKSGSSWVWSQNVPVTTTATGAFFSLISDAGKLAVWGGDFNGTYVFDPATLAKLDEVPVEAASVDGNFAICGAGLAMEKEGLKWEVEAHTSPTSNPRRIAGNQALGENGSSVWVFEMSGNPFNDLGDGCPGTGGLVPQLSVDECVFPGAPVTLTISNAPGGSFAIVLMGSEVARPHIPFGGLCDLYVTSLLPVVLSLPLAGVGAGQGSVSLNGTIPTGVSPGTEIALQAVIADPGASPLGATTSNGQLLQIQ